MSYHADPFIGVDGAGNCLCGPYLPLSLVRLGPDTVQPASSSGYQSHQPIIRFSHTHVSGTGGAGRYGNIGVTPSVGALPAVFRGYERDAEQAEPGYYRVTLQPAGIDAELTVTPRVGVHRYRFPAGADARISIDASAVISLPAGSKLPGTCIGGFVEWVSDHEVIGRGDFRGGWGHEFPYSVYFYAAFDQPARTRDVASDSGYTSWSAADGVGARALAGFGPVELLHLHVGISYVSVAKARASVDRETCGRSFDDLRAAAAETWQAIFQRIAVTGGTAEQQTLFYSLFMRLLCMPSDLGTDDEFPLWHSGVRHFTDYYALWDSVRNTNSLISLFAPDLEAAMLTCLLDIADHIGWLPDAWIAGHSAMIQGGSSADILFCEAALKGLTGIDYGRALRHMRANAEVESPDPWLYGRYLREYRDRGYLSTTVPKGCVSRQLEYAYQDWCIGTLAAQLGETAVAAHYQRSSQKLWHLWRADLRCFAPRHPDGAWVEPFDPAWRRLDWWNDPYFYEGTSLQWSFHVQHDLPGLMARHGGPDAFVEHLDRFFDQGHYFHKETVLHVPYLYIYAGRPDKAAERVRACMQHYYRPTRDGLYDNEDMGCQSAWYMCSAIGLYPIMGQDIYLLVPPIFPRTVVQLGNGAALLIEAPALDGSQQYIVAATLNGQPLERAWLRHGEIAAGATVQLHLDAQPADWGSATPPPSCHQG